MNIRYIVLIFILTAKLVLAQGNYPIVFIHGIAAGNEKWADVAKKYGPDCHFEMKWGEKGTIIDNYEGQEIENQVWNVSYYSDNPIDEGLNGNLEKYSRRLEIMIEKIKYYSKKDKVIIIAHSMGGLISRRYMSMSNKNNDSVYKVVTVTTPHEGEKIVPPIIGGQIRDMGINSSFIKRMNTEWSRLDNVRNKWGVIGAIDSKNILNKKITDDSTDSAGPGFVTISSAIPYGEWKRLLNRKSEVVYDSPYFAYLVLVDDNHNDVLKNPIIDSAIEWALK